MSSLEELQDTRDFQYLLTEVMDFDQDSTAVLALEQEAYTCIIDFFMMKERDINELQYHPVSEHGVVD